MLDLAAEGAGERRKSALPPKDQSLAKLIPDWPTLQAVKRKRQV